MRKVVCVIVALLFAASIIAAQSPKSGSTEKKSPSLILESANSNENVFENDEFISYLKGNVVFIYDDIKIKSDEATWWRNQGKVYFKNNVKVYRGAQTVTCDQMNYAKNNNLLIANGRFVFIDTLERTKITGTDAEYNIQTRYFQLTGKPNLIRYDTASAETLFISAERMWYIDSIRCANVVDSVKIIKGKLFSTCKAAKYYTNKEFAQLRLDPFVIYEISNVKGDSIDLYFGKNQLQSATVMGHAVGSYIDTIANTKDSSYTNVWGDSLLMTVSDSGNLDSLWIFGKAKSKNYESKDKESVNEASGKKMLMSFTDSGVADKVKIWGNAKSKYFVTEQKSKGINEASGDSITVTFKKGRASRLTLAGSARGIYFPRDL
ncbi:MAG: LptA/OstA family protein [Fibrobacterota bacterium]|nr:LptA/OstA family protein [Chitinispirillaceae bacterium]